MFAYWFNKQRFLYTINIAWCIAIPVNSCFHAIGCAANLGTYLLNEFVTPGMPWRAGIITALYIVEKVKEHDAFCGGPSRLGFVSEIFWGRLFDSDEIEKYVSEVRRIDLATKAERNKQIQAMLSEVGRRSIPDKEPPE